MATRKTARKTAGISDEAVERATGRTWGEWCRVLDRAGAKELGHKGIVAIVSRHGVGPWWGQMVTVGYEQARGLREKHETARGYQVSRSMTVPVALPRLYRAWADAESRGEWLNEPDLKVRRATRNKSMRLTWKDGATSVEVNFYAKGTGKSQVTVQHNKLATGAAGARMKAYWGRALERCREAVMGEGAARSR